MAARRYKVTYERDETGWWVATVPAVPGCITQGKNLAQARRRIREALSLLIGDRGAGAAVLEDDVKLPGEVRRSLQRLQTARAKAEEAERRRQAVVQELARWLAEDFSYQDVGEFLNVSRQRVGQLVVRER